MKGLVELTVKIAILVVYTSVLACVTLRAITMFIDWVDAWFDTLEGGD